MVSPPAAWMFGTAGAEHMRLHGSTPRHFAKIAEKNHRHSTNNPYVQFQTEYSLAEIEIVGQAMATDMRSTFDTHRARDVVGTDMSRKAAVAVYAQAQLGPEDVQVIELHDCFSANELLSYEALGLAAEGEGHHLVDSGDTTYGGRWVVNPSSAARLW